MIRREKCIVMDVDGTLCLKKAPDQDYADVEPRADVLTRLREYRAAGFYVILATARNMNTHSGNIGLITATTAKTLMQWLDKHDVPYDELYVGKPWGGKGGFYVDDKALRPDEFLALSYDEVLALVGGED